MQPPQHDLQSQGALLDFQSFTDVLCGIAIRTGLTHELDKVLLDARTPAERVINVAKVVSRVATTDPGVSRILDRLEAMTIMRNEVVRRMGKGKSQS